MNSFLEKLNKCELKRGQSYFYTLGTAELDRLWSLDQNSLYLIPDDKDVEAFAATSYLYGLMGYTASNYTAVPTGFLVSYKNNDDVATIVVHHSFEYYREQLATLAKHQLTNPSLSVTDREIFEYIATNVQNANKSLTDIAIGCNILLTKNASQLRDRIQDALFPFSGDPHSLNSQNCDNNHVLITKICCSLQGVNYDNASREQLEKANKLQQEILSEYILPAYLTYRGTDRNNNPIPQDGRILQSEQHLKELVDRLEQLDHPLDPATYRRMCIILNMCSTDYTADMVYAALNIMSHCTNVEQTKEAIEKVVPSTPRNWGSKHDARRYVDDLIGSTRYGNDIDSNLTPEL